MPSLYFADISEWQAGADLASYRRSGHDVLIIRAHNGYRPDKEFSLWRLQARALGFTALGFYHYLVQDRDPGAQARDFIATVGPLRSNEFVVCDSEEGAGDQTPRVRSWFMVTDSHYGTEGTLYASEFWFKDHLGGSNWDRPVWMAAYGSVEPTDHHDWWQHSDGEAYPGLGVVDGNIYHGTSHQFAELVTGKHPHPHPPPPRADKVRMAAVVKTKRGMEMFVERPNGEVWHKWQLPDGRWSYWQTLGIPGGS